MSIATQIGRIAKAKKDIKEVVNQDFEIINNETIDEYAEKMGSAYDEYESYIPWEHGEGDEFTFKKGGTGSYLKELEINGNTKQDNYTGKNLFDYITPISKPSYNGITCTIEGDIIVFNGTATADNTTFSFIAPIEMKQSTTKVIAYYVSGSATTYCTLRTFDSNWSKNTPLNLLSLSSSNNKMQATSQYNYTATSVSIRFNEGSTASNFRIKIMVTDNTNTDFEPYVGGTPSPNQSYPQDVRVVTGNNSVKVVGKNLFDKTITKSLGDGRIRETTLETGKKLKWNSVNTTTNYIWLCYVIKDISNYVGKTVRFKTNFSASASNTPQYAIGICDSDGNNRTSKAKSTTSGNTISFTIPSLSGTQTYLYVLLYANSGGALNPNDYVDFTNMILTIDNEDMTYIPYQSQTYPINLGTMELCKIRSYQDKIRKSTGKNLFNASIQAGTYNTATYTVANDGLITQSATDDSGWGAGANRRFTLNAGTYTISIIGKNSNNNMQLRNITDGGDLVLTKSDNATFTLNRTKTLAFKTYGGTYPVSYYVQIEQNSQATNYEPYGEQWYIKKNIGKVVLDGSENYVKSIYSDTNYCTFITNDFNSLIGNNGQSNLLSNYFISNNIGSSIPNKTGMSYISKDYGLRFAIEYSNASDVAGFKSWLSTNTPTVYYVLANPTYEIITNETLINQLEELTKLDTYNNYSAVTATGDLINPELECVLFSQPAYQK